MDEVLLDLGFIWFLIWFRIWGEFVGLDCGVFDVLL